MADEIKDLDEALGKLKKVSAEMFEAAPPEAQQEILRSLSPTGRILMRNGARALRLRQALDQIEAQLQDRATPPATVKALRARVQEYKASLAQLEDFAEEGEPTGNPVGVDVGAPSSVTSFGRTGVGEG